MKSLNHKARKLFADCRGTVSVTFAVAAIPLFLAAGVGLDFSRAASLSNHAQSALDSAAMAAAVSNGLSDADRIKLAKDTFAHNFKKETNLGFTAVPVVTISDEQINATVDLQMPTTLMKLAGINTIDLRSVSQVDIPASKKAEIALVLDYSGSMNSSSGGQIKYIAMRNAAVGLVTNLSTGENADKVKFGIVPFSHHVQVSLPGEYVVGGTSGQIWSGCTQDRKYPYNTTDATPVSGNDDTKWGHPQAPAHASLGCAGYAANNLVVKPISDDHAGIISQLYAMTPYAWTHIALGFEYGWHLVSDTAPFSDVAANNDADTQKFIILLTDGAQTEPAFGPGGTRNVAKGEQNLETLCTNAKAQDITVVTVAFDLNNLATKDRLKNCSSDPAKHFFIAEDGAALASVFEQIKTAITAEVFISK